MRIRDPNAQKQARYLYFVLCFIHFCDAGRMRFLIRKIWNFRKTSKSDFSSSSPLMNVLPSLDDSNMNASQRSTSTATTQKVDSVPREWKPKRWDSSKFSIFWSIFKIQNFENLEFKIVEHAVSELAGELLSHLMQTLVCTSAARLGRLKLLGLSHCSILDFDYFQ